MHHTDARTRLQAAAASPTTGSPSIARDTDALPSHSGYHPATQTSNVEIDERGYICSVDRAGSGMHVLRLTEDGKKAAGLAPQQDNHAGDNAAAWMRADLAVARSAYRLT